MTSRYVYLAGPISHLKYHEANDWRVRFQEFLAPNITALSPMRGTAWLKDRYKNQELPVRPAGGFPEFTDAALAGRDHYDILHSDVVLANFIGCRAPSLGTAWEIGIAWQARVPVLVVCNPGNVHDHGLLRASATWWVGDVKEAAGILNTMLGAYV